MSKTKLDFKKDDKEFVYRKVKMLEPYRKKDDKEFAYRRGILEALLYHSITNGNITLPTIEELIHREVIDGTVEYIRGRESRYQPPGDNSLNGTDPDSKVLYKLYHDINLEGYMWEYFQKELTNANIKLNPKIEKALVKILEPHWKSDESGDGEYESELNLHFKLSGGGGICEIVGSSTFSLPQKIIHHVQKEVLPSLSESERETVEKIGSAMQKYIGRDLKYIKETYRW